MQDKGRVNSSLRLSFLRFEAGSQFDDFNRLIDLLLTVFSVDRSIAINEAIQPVDFCHEIMVAEIRRAFLITSRNLVVK